MVVLAYIGNGKLPSTGHIIYSLIQFTAFVVVAELIVQSLPNYASVAFRRVWRRSGFIINMVKYRHIQASAVEIHTPTQSKLIGRCMTDPPPVLSPSSNLPPPSSLCAFIARKKTFKVCLQNVIYFFFFMFENRVSLKMRNLKFH
jgi:hypothetical protein